MTHYRSGWRKIAVIVLLCSVVVAGAAWFIDKYFALEFNALIARIRPVPTAQQIEIRRLRKIAGWFSRDCGHVPRHGDADPAIACAKDALNSGERFYVSFDYVGVDSRGTTG